MRLRLTSLFRYHWSFFMVFRKRFACRFTGNYEDKDIEDDMDAKDYHLENGHIVQMFANFSSRVCIHSFDLIRISSINITAFREWTFC